MKRLAILVSCLLPIWSMAQDSTWVPVYHPAAGCSWLMPGQPSMIDTLQVRMYSLEMDSTLGIAVHFVLGVSPDTAAAGIFKAAWEVEQDTLRAMAQVMLFVSGAELLAIADTTVGAVPALDLTMETSTEGEPEDQVTRLRLIYHDRRFMTFGVTAPKDRSLDVIALGNALHGTIQIDQP
jgi:hypothetical protein